MAAGAGLGKLADGEVAGGGWAAATALLGGAANAAVGVAAVAWEAICSCALAKFLVRIWFWFCMDWMICSIPEVGRSSRILSIRRGAATTSMVRQPSFWTSAASGRSRAPIKASTACLSAASSSRGCRRLASFSASPASSIISFEPLLSCFKEAHASSRTEPAPKRDSSVSLAASQVASSSRPARMLEPVAPISSWHQVILALSVLTSPSWNLCSSSANQSDSTCCLWSYFPMWLTMEFIVGVCFMTLIVSFSFFFFTFLFRAAFYFLLFLFRTAFYFLELLYFFSFTYVLFLVSTRTSNPPPLPPFVSEALFCLCRGTNIYNFWGCIRISRHVPRLFILFNFSSFSQWILYIAGARETQEDTL